MRPQTALRIERLDAWVAFPLRIAVLGAALVLGPARSTGAQSNDLAVQFAPTAGTFVGTETVVLTAHAAAEIHYTLDGSTPNALSPVYRDPLTIERSTRLRALAIVPARAASEGAAGTASREGPIATETYLRIAPDAQAFTSHLPIILIHTFESGTPSPYGTEHVSAVLQAIEPRAGVARLIGRAGLDARIGIHVRGESSRNFPKKQYAIELRDDSSEDDAGQPLLGMPSHADWVLSDPVTYDRSLIRNALAYAISNRIGRYAPRTRFAEVFLVTGADDVGMQNFLGFFTLIEKIDRGATRVDVSRLPASAVELPALSGGFVVRIDKGTPDFAAGGRWLQFVYPNATDMARPERKPQLDYIRAFIDGFVQAASAPNFRHPSTGQHYSEFIDVDAWIDHHIINTLAKNPDGMRYSTFFHKDRDGRLAAGPVWDFDRTFGTPYDVRALEPEEWATWQRGGQNFAEGWWALLFRDPVFTARYRARFTELLNGDLSADNLVGIVDALATKAGDAAGRNFQRWTQTPPWQSHAAEIAWLQDFLRRRVAWIKGHLETNF